MTQTSVFEPKEPIKGVNEFDWEDGSGLVGRNRRTGDDGNGTVYYQREATRVSELPELERGFDRKVYEEGLKVVLRSYYGSDPYPNSLNIQAGGRAIVEELDSRARGGSGEGARLYQENLKALYADFAKFCDSRALSKSKAVSVYTKYKTLIKQPVNIPRVGPKVLQNLRNLWDSFASSQGWDFEEENGDTPRTAINVQKSVYFDMYNQEDDVDDDI